MRLPLPVSVRIVVNVCSTFCNAASILVPVKLPTPKAPEVIEEVHPDYREKLKEVLDGNYS